MKVGKGSVDKAERLRFFCVLAFATICLGGSWGCQVDVSGAMGGKLFYPDSIGGKTIGDPRRPMYEGNYSERHASGGEFGGAGFQGMNGGGS